MCQSKVEKEDIFISQNAAGDNAANLKNLGNRLDHMSVMIYEDGSKRK